MSARRVQSVYESLLRQMAALPVVDTHEHLMTEADFIAGKWDFGYIMSYTALDLGGAGLYRGPWGAAQNVAYEGSSPADKWRTMAPYWPRMRDARYAACTRRTLQRFFGVADLDERAAIEVSERIREYQYPGVYRRILQEGCGIRVCLKIGNSYAEPHYFAPVLYICPLAGAVSRSELEAACPEGLPATSAEYIEGLGPKLDEAKAKGAVCIKIGWTARRRPIRFLEHPQAEVERAYQFLKTSTHKSWDEPGVMDRLAAFHDMCFRFCFGWAGRNGVPVQVHSGFEFDQPWDGRPSAFLPCLTAFRETQFAILHGAYPYLDELTGLARGFPNVTLDLAWLALLSGPAADLWLAEWLEVLPSNKLLAFGGDGLTFFEVCTHLDLAREMLARALAQRVAQGLFTLDEAVLRARQLLHDNPWEFYHLEERWHKRQAADQKAGAQCPATA
jgi:uncharacterized protein